MAFAPCAEAGTGAGMMSILQSLPTTGIVITLLVVLTSVEFFRAWDSVRFRSLVRGLTICLVPLVGLFLLVLIKQVLHLIG